jgi:hypothetical protein
MKIVIGFPKVQRVVTNARLDSQSSEAREERRAPPRTAVFPI